MVGVFAHVMSPSGVFAVEAIGSSVFCVAVLVVHEVRYTAF
jgi:hypothetical protein